MKTVTVTYCESCGWVAPGFNVRIPHCMDCRKPVRMVSMTPRDVVAWYMERNENDTSE